MKRRRHDPYTLSGPGVDRGYDEPQVALSAAITHASRAAVPCTYYIRDADGDRYGYAARDDHGCVAIHRDATERH